MSSEHHLILQIFVKHEQNIDFNVFSSLLKSTRGTNVSNTNIMINNNDPRSSSEIIKKYRRISVEYAHLIGGTMRFNEVIMQFNDVIMKFNKVIMQFNEVIMKFNKVSIRFH